jgi:hypothetical protein
LPLLLPLAGSSASTLKALAVRATSGGKKAAATAAGALPLRQGDGDRKPSPPVERTARCRQRIKLQGMHERHNVSG